MPRPRTEHRAWVAPPAARSPPFLLARDGDDLVLIAPFAKRQGLAPEEAALVRTVLGYLRNIPAGGHGSTWIDPRDGTATPASIGEPQIRRRLIDNASFSVHVARQG